MNQARISKAIAGIAGEENVKRDEPMKHHTSFRIGGPADILVTPCNAGQVIDILRICRDENIEPFVMGNGSNLLVRDKGIRSVVIKISEKMSSCRVDGAVMEAEAGILLSKLSHVALEHELSGLEFASGIPGTLGGAVAMNAGAYNGEMKNAVVSTEYLDTNFNVRTLQGEEHQFDYRESYIQKHGGIVLKSILKLQAGTKAEIKSVMDDLSRRRREMQPLEYPSAGSVFRRPAGYFAAKLIDDCGLRGCRIGGAEVSNKHCGFIVNAGNAAAEDVIRLIAHIQDKVRNQFGVELQTEVKIIGEE